MANHKPAWWQLYLIVPIAAGLAALGFFLFVVFRFIAPKRRAETSSVPELEGGTRPAELEGIQTTGQLAPSGLARGEDELEVTERVRQLAKRDVSTAANVVRIWLQDTKT